jgi:hypothetical protein
MVRKLLVPISVLALAFVVVALASPAEALRCRCPAGAFQTTGNTWGFGSTCSAARTDLITNAEWVAEGSCSDGVCAYGALTITTGCHPSDMPGHIGQQQEDGTLQFKCLVCIDIQQ